MNLFPLPQHSSEALHSSNENLEVLLPHHFIYEGFIYLFLILLFKGMAVPYSEMLPIFIGYAVVSQLMSSGSFHMSTKDISAGRIGIPNQRHLHCPKYVSTVYTVSKYAFPILLTDLDIWKVTIFINTKDNYITNCSYSHKFLKASLLPSQIGFLHFKARQTVHSTVVNVILVLTWELSSCPLIPYNSPYFPPRYTTA